MSNEIDKKLKALGIGRFQVMALLQAARHYLLKGDLDKSKSFGLNRAIFYAWAKYYGSSKWPMRIMRVMEELRKKTIKGEEISECPQGFIRVLGECVAIGPRGYYMIGEQEQLPIDFDKQVNKKIRLIIDPEIAWKKALEYVSKFPRSILEDPRKFYKYVYEPVRDTFIKDLLVKKRVEPPRHILEQIKLQEEMYKELKKKQRSILDYMG